MTCIAVVTLLSACDAPADAPAVLPTSPTAAPSTPAAPTDNGEPPLRTADADLVLVEPMSGTGRADTPWFPVADRKYTIRVACTGDGTIVVSPGVGKPGAQKMDVPCDGTTRRVHVGTDEKKERVSITAAEGQRWTVSVVVSADFADATLTPSSLSL